MGDKRSRRRKRPDPFKEMVGACMPMMGGLGLPMNADTNAPGFQLSREFYKAAKVKDFDRMQKLADKGAKPELYVKKMLGFGVLHLCALKVCLLLEPQF